MALNLDPMFPVLIKTSAVTIVPADTTAKKTIFTAGANGSKVTMINSATDDTATSLQFLWMTIGATDYLLGCKTIPITAGFVTGTPSFSWFDAVQIPGLPIDRDGQRHLLIPPLGLLKINAAVTVTAAKTHYCTAQGMDF